MYKDSRMKRREKTIFDWLMEHMPREQASINLTEIDSDLNHFHGSLGDEPLDK